ncbi:uncharacterized protein LOC104582388 [Brachypodium distachyon]|uniref:uncharacterized protein LOC104582388 n=1 Tax=Brachypodium distachyon TaxID=15368 RepID=UPI00052FDB81|nr:uncharacterized protein LOC104582388 [Brachypodium distachyon]|eukprot:XP_010230205.1 uncharacterized protein LOC104582388 [Brachypodium distachyon]
MSQHNVNLVCWNVRGLNNPSRRAAVRDLIHDTHTTIICIQETKLQVVDDRLIRDLLGPCFSANFAVLPAAGTRGGMILAVSEDFFTISDVPLSAHSITVTVTMRSEGALWSLTSVYGPQGDQEKLLFIEELKLLQPVVKSEWILLGDFNLIAKAADKNNTNINRRLIGKFRGALDVLQLKEINLGGRRFTWSNEQENPVLAKIDHVFCSDDWDMMFPNALLLAIAIIKEVIWRLDLAEECRPLSAEERTLRRHLKSSYLGHLSIQKIKLWQRSRLPWIKTADANTKLFHIRGHFGVATARSTSLDWASLGYQAADLSALDADFTETEIKEAVFSILSIKAPGPDGFIGAFFKSCWEIIKGDVVAAIMRMADLRGDCMHLLNSANIILLPKKPDVARVSDYMPISLIHCMSKIFSKLLALRLAPELGTLVSSCQSAFIKRRCIHDNFLFVQNAIKALHGSRTPSLFLKLDISKAFDSVDWAFLLEVLEHLGFGQRWRDWICLSFASASLRVLLNGCPGTPFLHHRGLRQGDPLSRMLFILAIDPLQVILRRAEEVGLIQPVGARPVRCRISLYNNDAGIFANPLKEEIATISAILQHFGEPSGLITNVSKSEAFPIRCEGVDLAHVLEDFPATIATFLGKYLGLPLHFRKLHKIDFQPLIDKVGGRLKGWKGKNLSRAGRVTLAKAVLTSMATYHLSVIKLPKWVRVKLDRISRGFIWKGDDSETAGGGHSLINWKTVCRPKPLGVLGITDIERFGRALRQRWPWLKWTEPNRPWVGSCLPCDNTDMALFRASTRITVGDGNMAQFWLDNWSGEGAFCSRPPELFKIASWKNRSVYKELLNGNWIRAVGRLSSLQQLREFLDLARIVCSTVLDPN